MILITDILRLIRKGRAVEQASEALNELVRAVDETGKPGTLTIKLTVKPENGGGNMKDFSMALDMKKPMPAIPGAIFYSDGDGNLHRSDPNQGEMFVEVGKSEAS